MNFVRDHWKHFQQIGLNVFFFLLSSVYVYWNNIAASCIMTLYRFLSSDIFGQIILIGCAHIKKKMSASAQTKAIDIKCNNNKTESCLLSFKYLIIIIFLSSLYINCDIAAAVVAYQFENV